MSWGRVVGCRQAASWWPDGWRKRLRLSWRCWSGVGMAGPFEEVGTVVVGGGAAGQTARHRERRRSTDTSTAFTQTPTRAMATMPAYISGIWKLNWVYVM